MLKLLNKWDKIAIILTAIGSVALYFLFGLLNIHQGPVAQIYHNNQLVASLDLNIDTTFTLKQEKYPDLYGDIEIEVKDGKVRISKEVCPLGICADYGWTDSSMKPLVCLPNMVYVIVENENSNISKGDVVNQ